MNQTLVSQNIQSLLYPPKSLGKDYVIHNMAQTNTRQDPLYTRVYLTNLADV